MTYRAGWGKSFGSIGFSGDFSTMNFVWNNDWMCVTGVTQSNTAACGQNKVSAGTSPVDSSTAPNKVVANTDVFNVSGTATAANFVVAVSLWSLGDYAASGLADAAWSTKSDMIIEFIGADWSTVVPALTTAISYSGKPTPADTLSGIAGAQALAASSAAVLALAALY